MCIRDRHRHRTQISRRRHSAKADSGKGATKSKHHSLKDGVSDDLVPVSDIRDVYKRQLLPVPMKNPPSRRIKKKGILYNAVQRNTGGPSIRRLSLFLSFDSIPI